MDTVNTTAMTSTMAQASASALSSLTSQPQPELKGFSVFSSVAFVGNAIALFYRVAFWLVALVTYHIPRWTVFFLSWSGVISLEFNAVKVVLLLIAFASLLSWTIKTKYLNVYSKLRETPLRQDEKLDLHPDVATESGQGGINNYLDEFLSAIKVFGYLEKPVFHELARHLQTRRLVAGDTLSLDSSDFYVVVDGSVQVFAQIGSSNLSSEAYDDEDDNGFQLLNEVESGGTLSSLFTILRLFTEDVKLRYDEKSVPTQAGEVPSFQLDGHSHSNGRSGRPSHRPHSQRGGSRSQARARAGSRLRNSFSSEQTVTTPDELGGVSPRFVDKVGIEGEEYVVPEDAILLDEDLEEHEREEEAERANAMRRGSKPVQLNGMGMPPQHRARLDSIRTETQENYRDGKGAANQMESTIARAKVDATLAVIPAEAFKRLTKKFPKASAHIVQVILTRLHRVTFLTAHEYLGLTKELVRTEKAINELASYPLPPEFYESGGIERLRQRFLPERKAVDRGKEAESASDYFSHEKRQNSSTNLQSHNAYPVQTPYMGPKMGRNTHRSESFHFGPEARRLRYPSSPSKPGSQGDTVSSPASIGSDMLSPRSREAATSAGTTGSSNRVSRNVGDLLSMTTIDESTSILSASPEKVSVHLPTDEDEASTRQRHLSFAIGRADEFDLRDAVMSCISKSIGLIQPNGSASGSADVSPVLTAQDSTTGGLKRAVFSSSFGSLSYLGLQGRDDDSSVTGTSVTGSLEAADLENETEILFFPRDSTLVKAGDRGAGLFFVIEGWLDVSMPEGHLGSFGNAPFSSQSKMAQTPPVPDTSIRSKAGSKLGSRKTSVGSDNVNTNLGDQTPMKPKSKVLFSVKPGGIAGYLSSLSGFPSYVDIKAKTDVYVGFLPAKALERIMDRKPIVLLTLAKRLISLLPPLVVHIDSALDWQQVNAGQVIYRQGDKSDGFYFVNQGRLRSIAEKEGTGGVEILAEFGQGDSVGELDCITATPRPSTLHAIRDSELTRMPMTLFNAISVRYPSITIQISRLIGQRVRKEMDAKRTVPTMSLGGGTELGKNNFNLKTVAIIPVTYQVPITEFAQRLKASLEDIGAPATLLNQATVMHVQGRHAFSKMGKLKLAGWLAETEQRYRIVLYVADTAVSSPWTQTCIRQADCIMLVAHGAADPGIGEYERLLIGMKTTARKELVLLHPERAIPAGSTRPWLQARPWIHAWSHCEMGDVPAHRLNAFAPDPAPVTAIKNLKQKVQVQIGKYRRLGNQTPQIHRPTTMSDFARLARRLCGKSIGVVMGGGGARGISHVGVLKALNEAGIPVDMIGGTSIGSFVGGLYAREGDIVSTLGRAKAFCSRMSSLWRILADVTYPIVAYTTGHAFNRSLYKAFYDYHIEDMWLTYFCNTTNITHSRMDVHTNGYAWRYIRASMTLVGLLPPLSDDGNMLVDGGYTDNLPVSVMLSMGASNVFAVDVGSLDDTSAREFGESVSGWWVLLNRWNPWSATRVVPGITEIQSRLTYVSSVKTLEEAKNTPGVLYMRMPVEAYGTMQFGSFNEIMDVGYKAAKVMLEDWRKEGKIPSGMVELGQDAKANVSGRPGAGKPIRRNSI